MAAREVAGVTGVRLVDHVVGQSASRQQDMMSRAATRTARMVGIVAPFGAGCGIRCHRVPATVRREPWTDAASVRLVDLIAWLPWLGQKTQWRSARSPLPR